MDTTTPSCIPKTSKEIHSMILETQRLYLREMEQSDYAALCKMLQDEHVMYAYEHAFDDAEAQEWLDRQMNRYKEYGLGLWAVILKETDAMIGQCGLTMQDYNDGQVLEIGYLFQRNFWHHGYASEAPLPARNMPLSTWILTRYFQSFAIPISHRKMSQNETAWLSKASSQNTIMAWICPIGYSPSNELYITTRIRKMKIE